MIEAQMTLQTPLPTSKIGAVHLMLTFFVVVGSIALLFLCAWLILLILMQKPSANAGMGAALGGGAAESAFGGEASNVLTRWTVFGVIGFFVLTLTLSLAQIYRHHHNENKKELAPMAEEVAETPKSLTELPTDAEKAKADAVGKKANDENVKANEASEAGTSKADTTKATIPDTSKRSPSVTDNNTSKASNAAVTNDTSKKPSKSKISYRSDAKKSTKRKTASSAKDGSKNTDAKGTVAR